MTSPRWLPELESVESPTEHEPAGPTGSRRQVLRWTGLAAGAGIVGTGAFAGTAAASDCPRTPGFWANWDWCEVVANPHTGVTVGEDLGVCDGGEYELAGMSKTMAQWQAYLIAPTRGDKGHIMAKHVLATILNLRRRPGNDPDCSDVAILGDRTINDVKNDAVAWLRYSNFPGEQRDWVVDVSGTDVDGEELKNVLDAFNNGQIAGLECSCDGEEDGGGSGKGGANGNGGRKGRGR